jgi:hypothetical protein
MGPGTPTKLGPTSNWVIVKLKPTVQCRVGKEKLPDELVWVCYGKVRTVGIKRVDRKLDW